VNETVPKLRCVRVVRDRNGILMRTPHFRRRTRGFRVMLISFQVFSDAELSGFFECSVEVVQWLCENPLFKKRSRSTRTSSAIIKKMASTIYMGPKVLNSC
jgi:hypothetical protein